MDEPTTFAKRENKYNFLFRVIELVVCLLCLITFIVLICLCSIITYILAIILVVAALTTIIVVASIIIIIRLRKTQTVFHIRWLFIALASMICYVVCVVLFIIHSPVLYSWLLFLSLGMAVVAAIVFLLDFIYNLRNVLIHRKKNTRLNQVTPVSSVAVRKSEEKLAPNNEVFSTVECSVIIGDQLACNQQLCHVKWSSDQASTPTARLIYVQPCNSSVINKICPACKKINCEKCFEKEEKEADRKLVLEPQSIVKSTQFPEDDENICPLCTFKADKEFKKASVHVQTSDEYVLPESVLRPMQENIIIRHVHSAEMMENPSHAKNKLVQSFPATPRRNSERLMTCPKCRRRSIFATKIKPTHYCPTCRQRCRNKLRCTECYYDVPELFMDEELSAIQTDENEERRESSLKCPRYKKEKIVCAQIMRNSKMTQVSSEEIFYSIKFNEDKVTQVSLSEFVEETSETAKIEKREIETQASLHEFMEGNEMHFIPLRQKKLTEDCKATNVSSKELIEEMEVILLGKRGTERIYENKSFDDQNSAVELRDNESTQVSYRDFLREETSSPKENKLTQVSIRDYRQEDKSSLYSGKLTRIFSRGFVQEVRQPCGAPNCQHPMCAKYSEPEEEEEEQIIQVIPVKQTIDEVVQTEAPFKECPCTGTKFVDEETVTDQFKQSACQTTESLENTHPEPRGENMDKGGRKQMLLEKEAKPQEQEQELPKDLPECVDPKCTCIKISEKEILVCTYCESLLNNTLQSSKILEVQPVHQRNSNRFPLKSGCKCGLPKCICCKTHETEELQELEASPENKKCFCIETENGLLRCTLCESTYQERKSRQSRTSGGKDEPVCSPSVNTSLRHQGRVQEPIQNDNIFNNKVENAEHFTQTRNPDQMKTERSYKKGSEDEEQKNKSMEASEKNENEINEDDYPSSTCASETLSNESEIKYLPSVEKKMLYKKQQEDMSYYLANKDMERYSTASPEPIKNVTVFTLQENIQVLEIESKENSDAEQIEEHVNEDDEYKERMKSVWDGFADKHAAYQDRVRRDLESSIELKDDDTNQLHGDSIQILENTQSEMENIYTCMIKSLLERQSQKENNLLFLEKLNCACDSDAESSKHHADSSARIEEEICKGRSAFKGSPFFQFQFPKFDEKGHLNNATVAAAATATAAADDDDDDGNVHLDFKQTNAVTISSDILIISDNVSLSTITEEMSGTPSDLISISKESEPSQSMEQLAEKNEKEVDLNATYCFKIIKPVDGQQEQKKKCDQSCKRDTVYVPLIPCKIQRDKKDAECTPRNTLYSAKCKNVSPKSCSARSEKCPEKPTGFFEPFMYSQTYGSTKTSFTASDTESVVDSVNQEDYLKTLRSTTGSSVSINLLEDQICSPMVEIVQSQSVPITSRASAPLNEDTQKVYYCGRSIPCTPKRLRWQDTNTQSNSLTDISKTPAKKSGRKTFRKESEYDEGNETPSVIVIKNFRPENYHNDENEFAVNAKIVPPLPIANITPEQSESEDSRPISCSSHISARTLQTINNYNLECCSSLKKSPLQEIKLSKKLTLGIKSQPASTRTHACTVEKTSSRKHDAKFNIEPTIRERRISAPLKLSQRKKSSSSPKTVKIKSSTTRTFRPKTTALSPYKCTEKKKASSEKSSARRSRTKSESVSPEHEYVCHCEFYKKSRHNYCRIHGMGTYMKIQSTPPILTPIPTIKSTINSPKSPKRKSVTPRMNTLPIEYSSEQKTLERPKTWTSEEKRKVLAKSEETSPKIDDT